MITTCRRCGAEVEVGRYHYCPSLMPPQNPCPHEWGVWRDGGFDCEQCGAQLPAHAFAIGVRERPVHLPQSSPVHLEYHRAPVRRIQADSAYVELSQASPREVSVVIGDQEYVIEVMANALQIIEVPNDDF